MFKRQEKGFTLSKDQRSQEFILAATFLTPRFLNTEVVARTFRQVWKSTNGFKIRNAGNHTVLFVFDNLKDIDKIIQNQPWSFDKHLVLV